MMQLLRREARELELSSWASLLSEVATRLSIWFPVTGTGSEGKTNELEKSYKKKSGALDWKHRRVVSCGEEMTGPGGRTESCILFRCGFARHY